jgi:hypothetical protein
MIEYENEKGDFIAKAEYGRVPLVGETVLLKGIREKVSGWYTVNRVYTAVSTQHPGYDKQTAHVVLIKGRRQ